LLATAVGSVAHVAIPSNTFASGSHTHPSETIQIYDDHVFKVSGTAIDFTDNISVIVTGSVAFVSSTATGGGGTGTVGRISEWVAASMLGDSTLAKTGAGLLTLSAAGAYTLTVPATGTVALGTGVATRIAEWVDANTLQSSTLIKSGAGVLTLSAAGAYTLTVPATGTIALGTGTATRVAVWVDANTLTSSTLLRLDATQQFPVAFTFTDTTKRGLQIAGSVKEYAISVTAYTLMSASAVMVAFEPYANPQVSPIGTVFGVFLGSAVGGATSNNITTMIGLASQIKFIETYSGIIASAQCIYVGGILFNGTGTPSVTTLEMIHIEDPTSMPTGDAYAIRARGGIVVFNENGIATSDFRVEGDTYSNLIFLDASADMVGIGPSVPDRLLHVEAADAGTNTVTYAIRLTHVTTGAAAAGFGVGVEFENENSTGTNVVSSLIESTLSTVGAGWLGDLILSAADSAGTREGVRIRGSGAVAQLGFFGIVPVVRPTALTAKLTQITHTAPGTPDYAIQDLVDVGGFGFITKDEGNTVLSVVKNLQVRVDELETKFQGLGLLT